MACYQRERVSKSRMVVPNTNFLFIDPNLQKRACLEAVIALKPMLWLSGYPGGEREYDSLPNRGTPT